MTRSSCSGSSSASTSTQRMSCGSSGCGKRLCTGGRERWTRGASPQARGGLATPTGSAASRPCGVPSLVPSGHARLRRRGTSPGTTASSPISRRGGMSCSGPPSDSLLRRTQTTRPSTRRDDRSGRSFSWRTPMGWRQPGGRARRMTSRSGSDDTWPCKARSTDG